MSPRSPQTPRKRLRAADRRALILESAAKAFAEHGYERTSVEQIAVGAGIAKSVVYDHFPSKQVLHIALLRQQADALIAHAARRLDGESPEGLLRANTHAFFEFVEQHPFAWRMLFREPAEQPAIAKAHREIQREITEAIAQLVALGSDIHLTAPLPRSIANQLLAESIKSTNNTLAAWWWDHREITREQVTNFSLDLLWTGLRRLAEPR
jgi:AcrR family transcriptional regulator